MKFGAHIPFVNHLGFDQTYRDRVKFDYYESGHMAYLNQASAKQLKADIASFITSMNHPAAQQPVTAAR